MNRSRMLISGVILLLLVVVTGYFMFRSQPPKGSIALHLPKSFKVGEQITVPVIVDTGGETINAAEVYISYDPSKVKINSVDKEGSFFKMWITDQPSFSEETKLISFAGGLPTPGFKGEGQIGRVTLTPLTKGTVILTFTPQSRALKNDGSGSAISLVRKQIIMKVR